MKDIKTFLIGFLTCTCMFLIMGQTDGEEKMEMNVDGKVIIESNENGKYQAIAGNKFEYFYLLDTETGAVYTQIENPNKNTYKKRLADVWRRSPYVYEFTNSITP